METFENGATHVEGGGDHNQVWLNCGVYSEPVPNETAVHPMEHGAVWVTYDPSLSDDQLTTLRSKLPSTYVLLSPFESLTTPIVLSGWNAQLQVTDANDKRVGSGQNAPEAWSACTGALDAPGKTS